MSSSEEEKLFKTRFKEHKDQIFRLCLGYFQQDKGLAEDALQETFIKAWVHRKQFRADANWQTWIYRIAVNTCLLQLKKEKKEAQKSTELANQPQSEYDLEKEQQIQRMYACIDRLSPQNRMLILMVLEGIPYAMIEETFGLSPENLRVKIHRIKKQLYPCITDGKL
ncbi:MAG: RNA polymerase sigma factor [Cyclobacteriaceae bacterium]|uniref:RNA polymerase sigma factor n=1 Tax=Algoriphagus marincola TaxID=264027 RepID=A0ABS7N5D7_9BACT|nr:RNA polymerase sigma factor [Algoriphagus marincola]MBY5951171.1 RNA polymerase sigma factor [Algoriphagus marincola]MCR9085040.1 RNA polymerase sigma factor [Cyclobacteriaceae bacterium]